LEDRRLAAVPETSGQSQAPLASLQSHEPNLPSRAKKRLPARVRQALAAPPVAYRHWSMNFMEDSLHCGRKLRTLNLSPTTNQPKSTTIHHAPDLQKL